MVLEGGTQLYGSRGLDEPRHRGIAAGDQAGSPQHLLIDRRRVGLERGQTNSDMSLANWSGVSRSSLLSRSFSGPWGVLSFVAKSPPLWSCSRNPLHQHPP